MTTYQNESAPLDQRSELIYKKLARHLDNLPAGFPATKDGLELRLLHHLFTPAEADLATYITLIPEESNVIALRAGMHPDLVTPLLKQMAAKGLIFSIESAGRPALYMASQFVIGIWEYQVRNLDPDLIKDMDTYMPVLFEEIWRVPQLRTIPVNRSLMPKLEILAYENAEEMIRRQKKIVVAPCICRREKTMAGDGCDKPLETCLIFGKTAEYYERNGLGYEITAGQAIEILHRADEAGLVLQPGNYRKAGNICCCCGCCCGVLRTLKKLPRPVDYISSPFYAVLTSSSCSGCGTCVDRCQMAAVQIDNNNAAIDLARCIGCGLCITTCPSGSITLVRKPAESQPLVHETSRQTYLQLGQLRNKFGRWEVLKMLVRSKADRLLVALGIDGYYVKLKNAWK
jgi:Pyruvate/2-oxoacid:ferredoxin oxidoreductase delta subunit